MLKEVTIIVEKIPELRFTKTGVEILKFFYKDICFIAFGKIALNMHDKIRDIGSVLYLLCYLNNYKWKDADKIEHIRKDYIIKKWRFK